MVSNNETRRHETTHSKMDECALIPESRTSATSGLGRVTVARPVNEGDGSRSVDSRTNETLIS